MVTVLYALKELLKFQKKCSLAQIAKLCGKKQIDVLKVLNINAKYIKTDKKGNVLGFDNTVIFPEQKYYEIQPINYGCDEALVTFPTIENDLIKPYTCGGFGDNYTINVVLNTLENRKILAKRGYIPKSDSNIFLISKRKRQSFEEFWREDLTE